MDAIALLQRAVEQRNLQQQQPQPVDLTHLVRGVHQQVPQPFGVGGAPPPPHHQAPPHQPLHFSSFSSQPAPSGSRSVLEMLQSAQHQQQRGPALPLPQHQQPPVGFLHPVHVGFGGAAPYHNLAPPMHHPQGGMTHHLPPPVHAPIAVQHHYLAPSTPQPQDRHHASAPVSVPAPPASYVAVAASASSPISASPSKSSFSFSSAVSDVMDDLAVRFIVNLPAEELQHLERLCFSVEEAHWFYCDFYVDKQPKRYPKMKLKDFVQAMFEHVPQLRHFLDTYSAAEIVKQFAAYKHQVPVCGAIVLNEQLSKVLMVKPWAGKYLGFPRGKINQNETFTACAERELLEEAGLDLRAMGLTLREEDVIEREADGHPVKLFLVAGARDDQKLQTKTRKEIGSIEWVPVKMLTMPGQPLKQDRLANVTVWISEIFAFIKRQRQHRSNAKKASSLESSPVPSPSPSPAPITILPRNVRLEDLPEIGAKLTAPPTPKQAAAAPPASKPAAAAKVAPKAAAKVAPKATAVAAPVKKTAPDAPYTFTVDSAAVMSAFWNSST